jgi:hypothetical protein
MSLEAVFPVCKVEDTFFLHHATNVGLTAEFLNRLKLDDLPIMLAAAADALRTSAPGTFLPRIELEFDHFFKIRTLLPRGVNARKDCASMAAAAWWSKFEKMMRSGIYDGTKPAYGFKISTDTAKLTSRLIWDTKTIRRLNGICVEIENSAVFNPRKLKLPRGLSLPPEQPGAPWLWNPTHMFEDLNWQFITDVFQSRFQRMDNLCDWVNDHDQECAETLFLTCIILYFALDGGKDEVLGLRMTIYNRHALRFSIGRALHVQPGSIMRTGWNTKHPVSLSEYNDSHRTITMEAWCMNRGKYNYPVTEDSITLWKQAIADVPKESRFWDAYPPLPTAPSLHLPSSWRSLQPKGGALVENDEEDEIEHENDEFVHEDDQYLEKGEDDMGSGDESDDYDANEQKKSPKTTALSLQEKFEYLLSVKVSKKEKDRYTATIKELQALLEEKLTADPTPTSRKDLFVRAVHKLVTEHEFDSFMQIEVLALLPLHDWQNVQPEISAPFTEKELLSFCAEFNQVDAFR